MSAHVRHCRGWRAAWDRTDSTFRCGREQPHARHTWKHEPPSAVYLTSELESSS
ncbi:putative protein without homology [Propionibacterium freudenreichii subsp. shermanii]|nr:putative protein without homology [Propionibacterium freudenreichii subsp. shermanii]